MPIFINRRKELEELKSWFRSGKLAIITGRRRVGKSRLVLEFIKNKKAVYLLAVDKDIEYNLRKFSSELSKKFSVPSLRFNDFEEMFEFLESRKEIDLIVIDEFGYLVKQGIGEIQKVVDSILKTKKLILTGSQVSLMETKLIGYKSPLYGRADLIKKILPLNFEYVFEWFPKITTEDAVKIYGITGGIPKYLELFTGENIEKEIETKFFNPDLILFRDAKLLLEEELPEPKRYFLILEAIANGKNKISEISNFTGIEAHNLPYYLEVLRSLNFIIHEKPVIGKKRGIYKISDPYTEFWFRFIFPFYEEIESGIKENSLHNFRANFNTYLGKVFEEIILGLFKRRKMNFKFNFTEVGRWWHKDKEIDIVALNKATKEILFAECKWSEDEDAEKVVSKLAEKAEYVDWYKKERKESFAVFAKSFSKAVSEFEGKKVYCFDLKDLEKLVKEDIHLKK